MLSPRTYRHLPPPIPLSPALKSHLQASFSTTPSLSGALIYGYRGFLFLLRSSSRLQFHALLCSHLIVIFLIRFLGKLKAYVRNKARPEGCIAETYISNECLTFCSMYLSGIETRFNREERNFDQEKETVRKELLIFSRSVRPFGTSKYEVLPDQEFEMIQWYILNNCELVEPFFAKHKLELELQSKSFVEERHKKHFPFWFKRNVSSLQNQGLQEVSDELFSLACGPDRRVRKYTGCIVNGVRFHIKERDFHLRSQNSGVIVEGIHEEKEIEFYGVLTDIIQLDFIKGCEVVMFKCSWFDLDSRKRRIRKEGNLVSINVNKCWYENDPFILAIQAKQVFYLDDIKLGKDWKVVQKFHHRHLYDVPEIDQIESSEMFDMNDNIDQENEFEESDRIIHVDDFEGGPLHRDDVAPDVIDSDIVERSKNLVEDASMENFDQQSQRGLTDINEEEFGSNDDDDSDIDLMFH